MFIAMAEIGFYIGECGQGIGLRVSRVLGERRYVRGINR